MTDLPPNLALLVGVLIVSAAAALVAWLLRLSRFPGGAFGAAIAGGVLAGLLLGPAGLSRLRPTWYEHAFVGGVKEREALEQMQSQHAAEVAALRQAGVTQQAIEERNAEQDLQLTPLVDQLNAAYAHQQNHAYAMTVLFVCLAALCDLIWPLVDKAAREWASIERRSRHARSARSQRSGRREDEGACKVGVDRSKAHVVAGLLLLLVSAVPTFVVSHQFAGAGFQSAIIAWAVFVTMPPVRHRSGRLPRLLGAMLLSTILLTALALSDLDSLDPSRQSVWGFAYASALFVPFALSRTVAQGLRLREEYARQVPVAVAKARARSSRTFANLLRTLTVRFCIPATAALLAILIDPHELAYSRTFWIVAIVAIVWSPLGRALGLLAARRIIGERATFARCLRDVPAGTGALQLVAAALFFAFQGIDEPAMAALVLGALAVEVVTAAARRATLLGARSASDGRA